MSAIIQYAVSIVNDFYDYFFSFTVTCFIADHIFSLILLGYLLWYIKVYFTSATELIAKKDAYMYNMLIDFPSYLSGYTPTLWCFPATLNTCAYIKVQLNGELNYERELLETPDGGVVALDWALMNPKHKLMVLVLPGLTGCSQDNYVSHMVQKAVQAACPAVVMNYRGNSVALKTPRTFCATNYDDVHFVIKHVTEKYKDHKIMAIGLSMGGLKLAGYLAKHNNPCLLSYAMVVSAPMNLYDATEELEKVHNYMFFNYYLTRRINQYFSEYKKLFKEHIQKYESYAKWFTLRDFETKFIVKQFGYADCDEYYQDATLDVKIHNINVPTLFLNSKDDMFSPYKSFPIDKIKTNPYTAMILTKYGGHIAWCEGIYPLGCNFTCRILNDLLKFITNEISEQELKKS